MQQWHDQHQKPLGDINLPLWQQPPTSAPDTPSPWLVPTSTTLKADKMAVAKAKARETTSLAMTKDQVKEMLCEYIDLPFYSPGPEQTVHNAIQELPNHKDWPQKLLSLIKHILGTPCNTPSAPEFSFKLLDKAGMHNLTVFRKCQFDLSKALEANKDLQYPAMMYVGFTACGKSTPVQMLLV